MGKLLNKPSSQSWKNGDTVPLSENQRHLLPEKDAASILGPFTLPVLPPVQVEFLFRKFISAYNSLCVRFIKSDDGYFQQLVSADQVQIKVLPSEQLNKSEPELNKIADTALKEKFNYKEGLIRLVVLKTSETHCFIKIGVHYSLIDMYTNRLLSTHLIKYFQSEAIKEKYLSNFDFVRWQENYLESPLGLGRRDFWKSYLQPMEQGSPLTAEKPSRKKLFVSSKNRLKVSQIANVIAELKKYNIPVTAWALAKHQYLIRKIFPQQPCLQKVRVSGRENVYESLDISKVIGVVNNSLPIIVPSSLAEFDHTTVLEAYKSYVEGRVNQQIPYELIRKDIKETIDKDIETLCVGVCNVIDLSGFDFPEKDYQVKVLDNKEVFTNNLVNLNVYIYKDVLDIELLLDAELESEGLEGFDLESFYMQT